MDHFSVLVSAVGGAIGGSIGALIGQKIQNNTAKTVVTVISIVACIQIAHVISKNLKITEPASKSAAFLTLIKKGTAGMEANPTFERALKGMNGKEAEAFIQQKTKLGLKRLPYSDLQVWNELRIKLANVSPVLCAGFWTGKGLDGAAIQDAVVKLEEKDGLRWISTSLKAAQLELENAPYVEPDAGAAQRGIQEISDGLSKVDKERYSATQISGVNASDEDACWTLKIVLTKAESLKTISPEQFLRALAAL